jgi:DNA-binding CsgD family transcriptional regulator
MTFETDPNHRRRVDGQAMRERDAEVARLRSQGTPFRAIAERLGMSLGAVQKALVRARKLGDATRPAAGWAFDDGVALTQRPVAANARTDTHGCRQPLSYSTTPAETCTASPRLSDEHSPRI